MSVLNSLRRVAFKVRGIGGRLGLREHRVHVVATSYAGTHFGDGVRTTTETELLENGHPPKVRWLSQQALALGGLDEGTVEIGPLTPEHTAFGGGTVGTSDALLQGQDGALSDGDGLLLKLTGPKHPNGARYRITSVDRSRPLRVMLQAKPEDQ